MTTHARQTDRSDAQVVTGPPELFGALFERYADWLYGYCARRVGRQLAEDLVAETFLIAFSQRDRYDTSADTARPWLCGIITNLLRNHRRAEVRALRALARTGVDPLGGAEQVEDAFADRVDARLDARAANPAVAKALASMPADQRDALLLQVWAGMDYPELVAALGVRPGTLRSRLHRARSRLRGAVPDHFDPNR